jgi:uncharacterized membrane protein YfcA
MSVTILIICVLFLSLSCCAYMAYKFKQQAPVKLSITEYIKLISSGVLAFIADTIGVGSFAVNIALAKLLGTFHDDELPAMNNGAQVIPGTIESIFFMQFINVDLTTLVTLVAGTCLGGLLGGGVVSHLRPQAIRLAMMVCFLLIISLLIGHQFNLLPIGGTATALHSWKLFLGFIGMTICGALTSVGIGLFAMVQGVLFLLNVSPAVAFPIMTTAGAMQQPLTTMVFLQQDKIPLKRTLLISLGGCFGVLIIMPFFKYFTVAWLHTLLLIILLYNFTAISRDYIKSKRLAKAGEVDESILPFVPPAE